MKQRDTLDRAATGPSGPPRTKALLADAGAGAAFGLLDHLQFSPCVAYSTPYCCSRARQPGTSMISSNWLRESMASWRAAVVFASKRAR